MKRRSPNTCMSNAWQKALCGRKSHEQRRVSSLAGNGELELETALDEKHPVGAEVLNDAGEKIGVLWRDYDPSNATFSDRSLPVTLHDGKAVSADDEVHVAKGQDLAGDPHLATSCHRAPARTLTRP